ncbi:hypothetical protein [Actinomadura nitritigenes]|uniref:hypothetical protein n=1 Tax=Actinomadura nitritigenes TaxID=134602 RepID=UPI003D8F42AD
MTGFRANTAGLSTYYPPRTARLLYGTQGGPRRRHKILRERFGGVAVTGVEALRLTGEPGAGGLVIVHLSPGDRSCVDVFRTLAGRKGVSTDGTTRPGSSATRPGCIPVHGSRSRSPPPRTWRFPRLYGHPRYLRWPSLDQWQWALASRSRYQDQPPDPRITRLPHKEHIWLSADWSGLVLREGMALTGTRPDRGTSDPYYNHAALYARTIYLDAILIGLLQLHGICELEDALAEALDGDGAADAMPRMERRIAAFRHQLWWQHLSSHGVPDQVPDTFHRHHRLSERFTQVLAEISDFNRLARENQAHQINGTVLLFTLMPVPAGTALALL